MAEITHGEAIVRARQELKLDVTLSARTWRVRRLDHPCDAYFLVVFGPENAAVAVAAIGAPRGTVRGTAVLAGRGPHLTVDATRAIALTGAPAGARAEPVWKPCPASRSPLYPFWEVHAPSGLVYVDQQERVWRDLGDARAGG